MRKKVWKGIFLLTAALGVTGCSKSQTADPPSAIPAQENRAESKEEEAMEHEKIQGKTESEIKKGSFQLGVSVHDPSVVEADGTYYIFGSHMEAAQCTDLRNWKSFASGVGKSNPLFSN